MSLGLITPNLVRCLWEDALEHFDAKSFDKDDSEWMKIVGWFLGRIKVMDQEAFLKRYTTTILDAIYRPFEVGIEGDGYNLEDQIMILVHELEHVRQYQREPMGFAMGYIANKSARAEYEAKAFAADLEVFYWWHGALYPSQQRAESLLQYGLEKEHVEFAASILDSIGETIEQGASVSGVSAWVMGWLEANGVHPREGEVEIRHHYTPDK